MRGEGRPALLVQVFAGVTQVDQLAGDRQVGEGQSLADEEGPDVEMVSR